MNRTYTTKTLFTRFDPYLFKYKRILLLDLFCAALTTLTELHCLFADPHNAGMGVGAPLTLQLIGRLSLFIWSCEPSKSSHSTTWQMWGMSWSTDRNRYATRCV